MRWLPLLLCLIATPVWSQSAGDATLEKAALEQRLKTLEETLAGDVCADPVAAEAVLHQKNVIPAASSVPSPVAALGTTPLSRTALVDRLQQASVIVMTRNGGGSGFFITPELILTNSHVVDSSKEREAVVIGRGVDGGAVVDIIDRVRGKNQNGRDYAVLKLQNGPAPNAAVLGFSDAVTKLQPVVAAGYPALLLDNDLNFKALLNGDMSSVRGDQAAMPDLALSQGTVMALQNSGRGLPTIAHSAPISGGNSGGPLVDECGRVVGINTFINVSEEQGTNAGFALSSADIITYLKSKGIAPQVSSSACGG